MRPASAACSTPWPLDGSDHVRLYHHDAVEVLTHEIADGSLDEVRIYFPDPWHKKRHNKRRLVQPEFAKLIVTKLATDGRLHLATDWHDYAEQMGDVLDATPGIVQSRRGARVGAAAGMAAANAFRDPRPEARPRRLGPPLRQEPMTR
jgi:tRNA (guanine-N(7)-)-methyltransferase